MDTYAKIPEIFDALYSEDYMEIQDWDEPNASAMKLGRDTGEIATEQVATFLERELFSQETRKEQFASEMKAGQLLQLDKDLVNRLNIFIDAFRQTNLN